MCEVRRSGVIHLGEVRARIPGPGGEHFAEVLRQGSASATLSLGRFAPRPNEQAPHAQDELYVVIRGRGVFQHQDRRESFGPGDLLFVAAGIEHRFDEFSDDLEVWVIFHGPPAPTTR